MMSSIAGPTVSGSKYGIDQPPWANAPSVSCPGRLYNTVEADEVADDDAHGAFPSWLLSRH
jgi:hypothetical protein